MPMVNGKKYAYTEAGKAKAKRAATASGKRRKTGKNTKKA